jgi:hypothetical protein
MGQASDLQWAIAELQPQSRIELVEFFRNLYDTTPPKRISHDLLVRAIAFRL